MTPQDKLKKLIKERKPRASPRGPGYSIPGFAEATGQTPSIIRHAIKAGLIEAVEFNKRKRIPPREKAKFDALWNEPTGEAAE